MRLEHRCFHFYRKFFELQYVGRCSRTLALVLALLLAGGYVYAAPPDLTRGEKPANDVSINLGPTGMRGWVHHTMRDGPSTAESRQILVTAVDAESPADGILTPGDVILGASGSGKPLEFDADARHAFAIAIADAEASRPAVLRLLR